MTRMADIKSVEDFELYQAERRTRWQNGTQVVNTAAPTHTKSKYGNQPTMGPALPSVEQRQYASKREAKRASQLEFMQQQGRIRNLRTQVPFLLIPVQRDLDGDIIEKACEYVADFVYDAPDGPTVAPGRTGWALVVEDSKGLRTEVYRIKRKLMLFVHRIVIRES